MVFVDKFYLYQSSIGKLTGNISCILLLDYGFSFFSSTSISPLNLVNVVLCFPWSMSHLNVSRLDVYTKWDAVKKQFIIISSLYSEVLSTT